MMRKARTALLASALAACGSSAPQDIRSIRYQTGGCYGECPVYAIVANADGTGTFRGERFTAVAGERRFRITPQQFEVFADHLEPVRHRDSAREGECETRSTDHDSVAVQWTRAGGRRQLFEFYYGCDPRRNRSLIERLRSAPDLLPVAGFIR